MQVLSRKAPCRRQGELSNVPRKYHVSYDADDDLAIDKRPEGSEKKKNFLEEKQLFAKQKRKFCYMKRIIFLSRLVETDSNK